MKTFFLIIMWWYSTLHSDYPLCEYFYFSNGKISASKCFDADNRSGKARVFNNEGKLIYEKPLRKFAGHETVNFTFHPNGAVFKAEWHSAPDGGIQWYKSYDVFSPDGEILSHHEDAYDDSPGTTLPVPGRKSIPPVPEPPKPNECQPVPENFRQIPDKHGTTVSHECRVINKSRYPTKVQVKDRENGNLIGEKVVLPRDTALLITYIKPANIHPVILYDIKLQSSSGRPKRRLTLSEPPKQNQQISGNLLVYYYIIR